MKHTFDVEIATKYGIQEAILFENLTYWISKNKANNRLFHDGKYWTYNSMKAFSELFPYLTEKQIRRALKHLEDEGLLVTSNYNKASYDRTKWYALGNAFKAENDAQTALQAICPESQMDLTVRANATDLEGEPIPDINTDINTDKKDIVGLGNSEPQKAVENQASSRAKDPTVSQKDIKEIVDYLNLKADTKYKASSKATQRLIHARAREGFSVDDFKKVIDHKVDEWATDGKMSKYLRPATLFGSKFESYLNQQSSSKQKTQFEYQPSWTAEDLEKMFADQQPNIREIPDDELPF